MINDDDVILHMTGKFCGCLKKHVLGISPDVSNTYRQNFNCRQRLWWSHIFLRDRVSSKIRSRVEATEIEMLYGWGDEVANPHWLVNKLAS